MVTCVRCQLVHFIQMLCQFASLVLGLPFKSLTSSNENGLHFDRESPFPQLKKPIDTYVVVQTDQYD